MGENFECRSCGKLIFTHDKWKSKKSGKSIPLDAGITPFQPHQCEAKPPYEGGKGGMGSSSTQSTYSKSNSGEKPAVGVSKEEYQNFWKERDKKFEQRYEEQLQLMRDLRDLLVDIRDATQGTNAAVSELVQQLSNPLNLKKSKAKKEKTEEAEEDIESIDEEFEL